MTTQYTEEQILQLKEELSRPNAKRDRVAKRFGIDETRLRDFEINHMNRWVQSTDGWGRAELRKYAVARRHVDGGWDPRSDKIKFAKDAYDRGVSEMCQARDGFWIVMYSIPRKIVDRNRLPYFSFNPEGSHDKAISSQAQPVA